MIGLILQVLASGGVSGLNINTDNIPCGAGGCDPSGSGIASTIVLWIYAALGLIAVLIIIVSGVQFVISQGEPEKIKIAQATITYAVWGLVIATAAMLIVQFVLGVLS